MNFWQSLSRPFLVLAPLEGVTDCVYRQIVASVVPPDVFFTEFTSADGFCSSGSASVAENFRFTSSERPIVAQIWGRNPETLYETAKAVSSMGFSGIDINMGCPDRTVMKNGCGGAMIGTPGAARDALAAIKEGIRDAGTGIAISVKTRIGIGTIETERWVTFLLEQGIDALTLHARTVAELSKVPAHWDEVGKAVAIRDRMRVATIVIGNGDVANATEAMEKHKTYGVDGVMIGRGIFADIYAFDRSDNKRMATPRELLDIMERHIRLFDATWGGRRNYAILKKFYKNYVNGFRNATDWRVRFMETDSAAEALHLLCQLNEQIAV